MRTKHFSFALPGTPQPPAPEVTTTPPAAATETATSGPDWKKSVVDLKDILNSKPAAEEIKPTPPPAPEATPGTETETTATTTTEQKPTGSATFEQGFDSFKETAGKKLAEFVENPEDFAKMMVKFGNMGRIILLPSLYTNLMFPAEERKDLSAMLKKRIEAEKQNKQPDFNNYEKRLLDKYTQLEKAKMQISYTEEEITWLAKIVAKRIKDVTVVAWMEKYDWAIALGYLEFKHASTVLTAKVEDFATKRMMQ